MKKLIALALLAMLLAASVANGETLTEQIQKQKELQERLTQTAYEVYGKATDEEDANQIGVFRTHGHLDFSLVIYYRTLRDETLLPFEQLYFDLFQYETLERFFADKEVNGLFFAYYWNYVSGRYNKIFTGTITREAFEGIDLELYDELFYFDYLEIKQFDKQLFPQFNY